MTRYPDRPYLFFPSKIEHQSPHSSCISFLHLSGIQDVREASPSTARSVSLSMGQNDAANLQPPCSTYTITLRFRAA